MRAELALHAKERPGFQGLSFLHEIFIHRNLSTTHDLDMLVEIEGSDLSEMRNVQGRLLQGLNACVVLPLF